MMDLKSIIFGFAVLVICVGSWDLVREADAESLQRLFEKLGEGLIGRLCGWWLLAALLLTLLGSVPN